MSWCDKLASTPTVGLRFSLNHKSSDKLLDALAPLLDSWAEGNRLKYSMEKQDSFSVTFTNDEGFTYSVDQYRFYVEFKHRWRITPRSGGAPVAKLISESKPFTELLPQAADRVIEMASAVNGARPRNLMRIGIVSSTTVALDEAPPGAIRLIKLINKPWETTTEFFDIQLTGEISKTDDFTDRCVHSLQKAEDNNPDNLMSIKLDWQRIFKEGKVSTSDVLKKYVGSARADALRYFEDFAEGSRFDEQLLNDPA